MKQRINNHIDKKAVNIIEYHQHQHRLLVMILPNQSLIIIQQVTHHHHHHHHQYHHHIVATTLPEDFEDSLAALLSSITKAHKNNSKVNLSTGKMSLFCLNVDSCSSLYSRSSFDLQDHRIINGG